MATPTSRLAQAMCGWLRLGWLVFQQQPHGAREVYDRHDDLEDPRSCDRMRLNPVADRFFDPFPQALRARVVSNRCRILRALPPNGFCSSQALRRHRTTAATTTRMTLGEPAEEGRRGGMTARYRPATQPARQTGDPTPLSGASRPLSQRPTHPPKPAPQQ